MARMIDADRLLRELTALSHGQVWPGWTYDGIRLLIERQPTLTPPNEPLTLEKLENMEDTTPVWWDQINSWVLVYKGNLTTWSGKHLYAKGCNGKFYRRPLEGEEETP